MVVLAASICTKGGKAVLSRQFHPMTRTRIESLLASFPKLIPTNSQHTSVETGEVRYVYQPLEELYILLITNKASNILQDIDTLHLFARVVTDMCRSADEREIHRNAFELLGAFDEIVSLGYREQVNVMQVRSVLEMESHEEKIQDIIARNKEAEAKEELKRRARQLEMQRREQQKRASSGMGGGMGSMGGSSYLGGGVSGYAPVSRFEAPEVSTSRTASPAPAAASRAPAFKGSGMKLGASKKTRQAELIDALGGEALVADEMSAPPTPQPVEPPNPINTRGSLPPVDQESVHIAIKEQVKIELDREGGVKSMDFRGELNLQVSDAAVAHIKLALVPPSADFGADLQLKQHPSTAKFTSGQSARLIQLKDSSRAFPVNQSLGVLKWRYQGKDESFVPLSINCWPSPSNDGTVDVNIEYELENEHVTLYDVVISIPLPAGSYPTVASHTGTYEVNPSTHSLDWRLSKISPDERDGSLEFTVGGDDAGAFFPVRVNFVGQGSIAGIAVEKVMRADGGEEPPFSVDSIVLSDDYLVV
ncbi:hypothetical protein CONPUDRAFT_116631 [Coniophora puteana RWD-64-598 SS2]|uniref:Coatomer subunit delta n=1 Tax=Coniophora puteana (strain RWD-64-598) TaxID=741705 RepID=A0A5M3N9F6_CONPW|nr:uncharacterized protein CONPUDRAFT_116631 [Coniophora puteana RWD-64-598 SS2]EIW87395.1 hypothetical protein CONPUDRAFT_116631 [Coniophora puteana RWD-64-598 SS2]